MHRPMNTVTRNVTGQEKTRPAMENDPKSIREYGTEKDRAPAPCSTGFNSLRNGCLSSLEKKNMPDKDRKLYTDDAVKSVPGNKRARITNERQTASSGSAFGNRSNTRRKQNALKSEALKEESQVKRKRTGTERRRARLRPSRKESGYTTKVDNMDKCIPESANTWDTPLFLPFSTI